MKQARRVALAWTLALTLAPTLAVPAAASIPGNLEQVSREGILHVCRDKEPGQRRYIVCDEQVAGPDSPYTGNECVAKGLPASCTIDFIPGVVLRGSLQLIYDDDLDKTVVWLRLNLGTDRALVVEMIDGSKVGNWNPFNSEFGSLQGTFIQTTNAAETAYQYANGNLVDLGEEILEEADAFFAEDLSDTVPVFIRIDRANFALESDQSGAAEPLSSASRWRVRIEFARVRP